MPCIQSSRQLVDESINQSNHPFTTILTPPCLSHKAENLLQKPQSSANTKSVPGALRISPASALFNSTFVGIS